MIVINVSKKLAISVSIQGEIFVPRLLLKPAANKFGLNTNDLCMTDGEWRYSRFWRSDNGTASQSDVTCAQQYTLRRHLVCWYSPRHWLVETAFPRWTVRHRTCLTTVLLSVGLNWSQFGTWMSDTSLMSRCLAATNVVRLCLTRRQNPPSDGRRMLQQQQSSTHKGR